MAINVLMLDGFGTNIVLFSTWDDTLVVNTVTGEMRSIIAWSRSLKQLV